MELGRPLLASIVAVIGLGFIFSGIWVAAMVAFLVLIVVLVVRDSD